MISKENGSQNKKELVEDKICKKNQIQQKVWRESPITLHKAEQRTYEQKDNGILKLKPRVPKFWLTGVPEKEKMLINPKQI